MKRILESRVLSLFVTIMLSTTISIIANTAINSNQVSYTNSKTNETTVEGSLDELFSAVDINERLGDTNKISSIGDGTVSGAISTLNTNLSGKQVKITGGASTITSSNLTASRALISNESGKVSASGVTSTQLGYLSGVTSNVQTQLNNRHWQQVSLPSPTVSNDGLTRTYSINLSNVEEIAATIHITNYGNWGESRLIVGNGKQEYLLDHNGYAWKYSMGCDGNGITIATLNGSTTPSSYPIIITKLYVRYK